jgi:hypothetical protein
MVSQIAEYCEESELARRFTTIDLSTPKGLLSTLQQLRQNVDSEGQATFERWRSHIQRTEFLSSAVNLAQYLALRRHECGTCKPHSCLGVYPH